MVYMSSILYRNLKTFSVKLKFLLNENDEKLDIFEDFKVLYLAQIFSKLIDLYVPYLNIVGNF